MSCNREYNRPTCCDFKKKEEEKKPTCPCKHDWREDYCKCYCKCLNHKDFKKESYDEEYED